MSTDAADVVIVGGGLVGAATAYFLAGEGVDCVVVERDGIASHASGFSYAALGTFDEAGMTDSAHLDVASLGMRLHRELAESLLDETGVNVEFRERPSLSLAFDEDEVVSAQSPEGWERDRRSWEVDTQGYTVEWLTTEEALQAEPRINPAALGAVYMEGTCDVNAQRLTLALAMGAEQKGARFVRANVTGLSRQGGRVRGVTMADGEIECGRVVVATGPWSEAASDWLGVPIRMQPWKGQILRLRLPGPPIRASVGGGDHFASTKPDGLTWVGPTFEDAGIDETTADWARDEIMAGVTKNVPSLAEGEVVMHTACVRPLSADRKLVLGRVPGLEGAYTATGGGRLGLMLGPAMARLTADLVAKETTTIPLDEFDPGRFAES